MIHKISLFFSMLSLCCIFNTKKCLRNISIESVSLLPDTERYVSANCEKKEKITALSFKYQIQVVIYNNSCKDIKNFIVCIIDTSSIKDTTYESPVIGILKKNQYDTLKFKNISKSLLSSKNDFSVRIKKNKSISVAQFISGKEIGFPVHFKDTLISPLPRFLLERNNCSAMSFSSKEVQDTFVLCLFALKIDTQLLGTQFIKVNFKSSKNIQALDSSYAIKDVNPKSASEYSFRFINKSKNSIIRYSAFIKDSLTNCKLELSNHFGLKGIVLYDTLNMKKFYKR
jgi:hypothetical protein